jgi:hypothetical protein
MAKPPTPGSEVYKPLALPRDAKCPCGAPAEFVCRLNFKGQIKDSLACRRDAESFAGLHGVKMPGGLYA